MGVKVMIQGDADSPLLLGTLENLYVLGALHSDFGDMNRIEAVFTKSRGCQRSKPLVEQKAAHAT